jgi:hypothetical protein
MTTEREDTGLVVIACILIAWLVILCVHSCPKGALP